MSVSLLRLYVADVAKPYTFTDEQLNEFLTGKGGDINAAAAEIWRIKAGTVAEWYNVSLDGRTLSRGEVYEHCMKQYDLYLGLSGSRIVSVRTQVTPDPSETQVSEFG